VLHKNKKNLVQQYKKVHVGETHMLKYDLFYDYYVQYMQTKDGNNQTGNNRKSCLFYEELDCILGCRATMTPPVLLESSTSEKTLNAKGSKMAFSLVSMCMHVAFDKLNEVEGDATDRTASLISTSDITVGLSSTSNSLSQVSVSSGSSHSDS